MEKCYTNACSPVDLRKSKTAERSVTGGRAKKIRAVNLALI